MIESEVHPGRPATQSERRAMLQLNYAPNVSEETWGRAPVWARDYMRELELALIRARDQIATLTREADGPVAVHVNGEAPVRFPAGAEVRFTGANGADLTVSMENEGRDDRAGWDRLKIWDRGGNELLSTGGAMNTCEVVAVVSR